MNDKGTTALSLIFGIGILAAIIAVGVIAGSFWVGLLAFLSLVVGVFSISVIVSDQPNAILYFFLWIVEIGLLVWAMFIGDMAGRWWWTPLWIYSAFPPLLAGINAWENDSTLGAFFNLLLSALTALFAILGPVVAYPVLSGESATFDLSAIWFWLALAGAFIFLAIAYYHASEWNPGRYVIFALLGLGLLFTAYYLNDFNGGWWWLLAFIPAAGTIGAGANELSGEGSMGAATGWVLMLICLGLAIAGPLWIAPEMQARLELAPEISAAAPTKIPTLAPTTVKATATALPKPTQVEPTAIPTEVAAPAATTGEAGPGFLPALWSFIVAAVTSIWGILYLVLLFMIGQLWIRRWGGLIVLLALLLVVAIWGGMNQAVLDNLTTIISSSPAGLMRDLGIYSEELSGTMGWGYLLLGLFIAIILIPATRYSYRMSREMSKANLSQADMGNTRMQRFLESRSSEYGRMFMGWMVNYVVAFGLFVAIWMALRRFADVPIGTDLSFYFIPDITVPSFKPVWDWPYFALGGIVLAVNVALGFIHRSYKGVQIASLYSSPWIAVFSAAMLTLFVPSGTLLFSLGQSLAMIPIVLLIFRDLKEEDRIAKQIDNLKSGGMSAINLARFSTARGIIDSLKDLGPGGILAAEELDKAIKNKKTRGERERKRQIREARRLFTLALNKEDWSGASTQIDALRRLSPRPTRDISEMQKRLDKAIEGVISGDALKKKISNVKRQITNALKVQDWEKIEAEIEGLKKISAPSSVIKEQQARLDKAFTEAKDRERKIGLLKSGVEAAIADRRWDEAKKIIQDLDALGAAAIASAWRNKLEDTIITDVPVSQELFNLTHPLAGFVIRQAPKEAAPDATMYSGGLLPGDRVACLDEKGNLFWMVGGEQQHNVRLGIKQPCGLLEIKEDQLLAVDRSGELVNIQIGEDGVFTPTERSRTAKQISAVALNSYRSGLAYVPADGVGVRGFFLVNKNELELPDLEGLAPALVFSSDSSLLAVGDTDGTLHVIDISTQQVVDSLVPSQKSPIQAVYSGPDNVWIAVHNDQVIMWIDSKEAHVAALSEPATCSAARSDPMGWKAHITGDADVLAAFEIRNLLALGSASGNVSTYILDKGLQLHEQYKAHVQPLSALQFTPDDRQLICVGEGVSLRSLLIR
ncbi:MAG: hypothetical protein U9R58_03325 [Chloroflexota bacterium]|nr:hypothetical protein [Chloroflexota bacterium]